RAPGGGAVSVTERRRAGVTRGGGYASERVAAEGDVQPIASGPANSAAPHPLGEEREDRLRLLALRLALLVGVIGLWDVASGRWIDQFFVSRPSLIGTRLLTWTTNGTLAFHAGTTLQEALLGLILGGISGVVVGFALG